MFITERGSNRFMCLSGQTPFEMEIVPSRTGTETYIYFRNATEFTDSESRQRYGCYKTEEAAKNALKNFMEAFQAKKNHFVFENEGE